MKMVKNLKLGKKMSKVFTSCIDLVTLLAVKPYPEVERPFFNMLAQMQNTTSKSIKSKKRKMSPDGKYDNYMQNICVTTKK